MRKALFAVLLLALTQPAHAGPLDWAKLCRKIQLTKLAVMYFCSFVVSACRLFGAIIAAKTNSLMAHPNSAIPFLTLPTYSPKPASVVPPHFRITGVLYPSALAKILFTVIKRVPVFVVSRFATLTAKNHSMHGDIRQSSPSISVGVETLRDRRPTSRPIPLIEPVKVLSVNDGVLSLRKSDQPVRWVGRLSNRMPLHSAFWHGLTSSKVVQLSRYSITAALSLTLFFNPVEASPKHWIKAHKRFLVMESAALAGAGIHAAGLHHCRQRGVERCDEHYGSAWAMFGLTTGFTTIVLPATAEGCWKENDDAKFCYLFAYSGSAFQTSWGLHEFSIKRREHEKSDPFHLALR